jgi:hypothetical protein
MKPYSFWAICPIVFILAIAAMTSCTEVSNTTPSLSATKIDTIIDGVKVYGQEDKVICVFFACDSGQVFQSRNTVTLRNVQQKVWSYVQKWDDFKVFVNGSADRITGEANPIAEKRLTWGEIWVRNNFTSNDPIGGDAVAVNGWGPEKRFTRVTFSKVSVLKTPAQAVAGWANVFTPAGWILFLLGCAVVVIIWYAFAGIKKARNQVPEPFLERVTQSQVAISAANDRSRVVALADKIIAGGGSGEMQLPCGTSLKWEIPPAIEKPQVKFSGFDLHIISLFVADMLKPNPPAASPVTETPVPVEKQEEKNGGVVEEVGQKSDKLADPPLEITVDESVLVRNGETAVKAADLPFQEDLTSTADILANSAAAETDTANNTGNANGDAKE